MKRMILSLGLILAAPLATMPNASAQMAMQQSAISTPAWAAMARQGSDFLESSSRIAYEKTENRQVRRFARAEVIEQVNLANRMNDSGAVAMNDPAATGSTALGNPDTRGLAGAGIGALVGGPVGAVVGAGIGATSGAVLPSGRSMTSPQDKSAILAQLQQLPAGPEFDAAYVQAQLQGHEEALALHSAYAQNGEDPQLRRIAANAVPLIRQHMAQLERMNRMMTQ